MTLTPTMAELEALIGEDAPFGDLTTEALRLAARPGAMRFAARGEMVVAGLGEFGLEEIVTRPRFAASEEKLVVEAGNVAEVAAAVPGVKAVAPRVLIASAGGVNAANAADHVAAGADLLVTPWPYQEGRRDVQVTLGPA